MLGILQVDEVKGERHLHAKKGKPRAGGGEPRGDRGPRRKEESKPEDAVDTGQDQNLRRNPQDQPSDNKSGKAEKLRLERSADGAQRSNDASKDGREDAGPVERVVEYVTNAGSQASGKGEA